MQINNTTLDKEKFLKHLLDSIYNKKYAYISYVSLHETDIDVYKAFFHDAEAINQDYFFMYTETGCEYKILFVCSSFRMSKFYKSYVSAVDISSKDKSELEDMLSHHYDISDHFLISHTEFINARRMASLS